MAGKTISQQQIAQELGVSQSLVSIVLNGRKEGIAVRTYERIWEFALSHGYSPKGMKMEPACNGEAALQALGYFLRKPLRLATKSNFFSHVTQGIHEGAESRNVSTLFLGSEADLDANQISRLMQREKHLRGIVILGQVAPDFMNAVRKPGKPVVYISARSHGQCHSVNSNEIQSAEQLVGHLHALGHRQFAFLGGLCARGRNEERRQAVSQALGSRGIEMNPDHLLEMDDAERMQGYEMAGILLARHADNPSKPFPSAWICVNGLAARGAINCLREAGKVIGKDVSVAAIDMTRVCSEEIPGITSAAAIPEALGREAARIILDHDPTRPVPLCDFVLPSTLVVRDSTGSASLV